MFPHSSQPGKSGWLEVTHLPARLASRFESDPVDTIPWQTRKPISDSHVPLFSLAPWVPKDQGPSPGSQDENREVDVLMELATPPCPACLGSTAQSWPLCGVQRVSWLPHRALFSCAPTQSSLTVTHSESWVIERRLQAGRVTFGSAWVGERVRPPPPKPPRR